MYIYMDTSLANDSYAALSKIITFRCAQFTHNFIPSISIVFETISATNTCTAVMLASVQQCSTLLADAVAAHGLLISQSQQKSGLISNSM